MNIPTPNEFAKQHGYNPFPPRWERWLSAIRQGILSAQPQAGRHVSVDEHPGKGTVINVADTSARRPGGGVTPPPPCPVSVHVEACWASSFGSPPDDGCSVVATGSLDIDLTVYVCPIDFTTSGFKIQGITADIDSSSSGPSCPDITDAQVSSNGDFFWDASTSEWTLAGQIIFPNWPATFNFGPVTVAGEDLIAAGVITVVNQGCPSTATDNPSATITYQFS